MLQDVSVALVEDHDATREALSELLARADRVTLRSSHPTAESLLATNAVDELDVLLVDIALPGLSGPALIEQLGRDVPHVRCLALTVFDDEENVHAAIRAGAFGYLLKDEPTERLLSAIHEAAVGEHPISSRVAGYLFLNIRAQASATLSDREEELATLLAGGLAYADCAVEMGVALGTVQDYVKRLYRKLGVSSKKEVRHWVLRNLPQR